MKEVMLRRFGNAADKNSLEAVSLMQREFEGEIKDMSGGAFIQPTGAEKGLNEVIGNSAVAVLSTNVSTWLLQFTSYPMASAVVKTKFLLEALASKTPRQTYIYHLKESGTLWHRSFYGNTREVSDFLRQSRKITEVGLVPMRATDMVVSSYIREAAELQVKATNPNLSGQSLRDATERLFTEAMETQQNSNILSRSGLFREQNWLFKGVTMFQQPINAVQNAVYDGALKIKYTGDAGMFRNAVLGAMFMLASGAGIHNYVREKQGKKSDYVSQLKRDAIGFPPGGNLVQSIINGDTENIGAQTLSDIITAIKQTGTTWSKVLKLEEEFGALSESERREGQAKFDHDRMEIIIAAGTTIAIPVAQAFSIPARNLINDYSMVLGDIDPVGQYHYLSYGKTDDKKFMYGLLTQYKDEPLKLSAVIEDLKADKTSASSIISHANAANVNEDPADDMTEDEVRKLINLVDPKAEVADRLLTSTKRKSLVDKGIPEARIDEVLAVKKAKGKKVDTVIELLKAGYEQDEIDSILGEMTTWKDGRLTNSDIYDIVFSGGLDDPFKTEIAKGQIVIQEEVTKHSFDMKTMKATKTTKKVPLTKEEKGMVTIDSLIASANIRNADDKPENDVTEEALRSIVDKLGLSRVAPEVLTKVAKNQVIADKAGVDPAVLETVKLIGQHYTTKAEREKALKKQGLTTRQRRIIMELYFGYTVD
jgi:hypothetical protein